MGAAADFETLLHAALGFALMLEEEDQDGGVVTRKSTVKELEQLLAMDGICLQAWIQVMPA